MQPQIWTTSTSAGSTTTAPSCRRRTNEKVSTVAAQVNKLRRRFGLEHICLVGDRGMLTKARIDNDLRPDELDWITALRAPQIKALVEQGALQLSLFDEQDLVEITHPDYPNERLPCCRNPVLAEERARKREALLAATEAELDKIVEATRRTRQRLSGRRRSACAWAR